MTNNKPTDERLVKILSETQATINEHNRRQVRGSVEVDARLFEAVLIEAQLYRAGSNDFGGRTGRTDLRSTVLSEIGDFFAGFGGPGEPETPEEMQRELTMRIGRILNDHIVNYPRCEVLVETLKECRIARDAAQAELQESRKAAEPELKPANLVNKFYERYPLASFSDDNFRAAALGYFMAGAELQCFGEFVKYEDLCFDE